MIENAINSKIQLDLSDPTMTWLHRAGMAGLWMTLKQLEQLYPIPQKRPGSLTWLLTPRTISLYWESEDFSVLDWLLKQSFQISNEGLIKLTALNFVELDLQTQIIIHLGITGTFLQHNQFFKSAGKESISLAVNGVKLVDEYQKAASYAHQHFAKKLCTKDGQLLQEPIGIAGWLYPGAVVRHYAFKAQTKFQEKPEHALALLFAPVACQYFILRSHTQATTKQYALVIPEVNDLEVYSARFSNLGDLSCKHFYVSSLGDAGLRFLSYEIARELVQQHKLQRCQVISFRNVTWSKQQKTRTEVALVEANEEVQLHYKLVISCFPEYEVFKHSSGNFIITSMCQCIIADNLANSLPWWSNFYALTKTKNSFKQIFHEKEGICKMIQNFEWNINEYKLFIETCHEALKVIYAKIYSKTKEDEYAQIERENTRIISQLGRCTNAATFREFISRLWGRAGHLSTLEEHWEELLPVTTGMIDWKIARDLTIIAIASYPIKRNKNAQNLKQEPTKA
ncbi:type I-MYXAN CRISPR-associated Cas8a1/Cmx1 [Nostoc linckia FACHB-104]|nr:type I-MYXAN CRISPR-associated Cas8a1/Cmx1 [Nostoc linckia FACHB-104]